MDGPPQQPRSGWGLPRSGTRAGASWEGEGDRVRPEPPRRGRGLPALLVVALGLLLGGGALWAATRGGEDDLTPGTDRVAQESSDAEPGTCLASLPSDTGQALDVVACQDQHLGEVIAVVELADDAWPGEAEVLEAARERCTAAFADYVGVEVDASPLNLLPVVPRETDWRVDGDRQVLCLAEGPALVGSVRGTGG